MYGTLLPPSLLSKSPYGLTLWITPYLTNAAPALAQPALSLVRWNYLVTMSSGTTQGRLGPTGRGENLGFEVSRMHPREEKTPRTLRSWYEWMKPNLNITGIWEFPLNSHYTESFEGGFCPYMDQCVLQNLDENDVLEWLQEDFNRYYEGNRAPYTMSFHTS